MYVFFIAGMCGLLVWSIDSESSPLKGVMTSQPQLKSLMDFAMVPVRSSRHGPPNLLLVSSKLFLTESQSLPDLRWSVTRPGLVEGDEVTMATSKLPHCLRQPSRVGWRSSESKSD